MTFADLPALMLRAVIDGEMLRWLAYVVLPGWILLPIMGRLLPQSRTAWYFAARVGAFAGLAYIPWLLSHDGAAAFGEQPTSLLRRLANGPGLVSFDRTTLLVMLAVYTLTGAGAWWRWGSDALSRMAAHRRALLAGEIVFLLALSLAGALRLVSHGIHDQEKFMDMAFLRSCIDATAMPPPDPWLHHLPVNYYYGGYTIFSTPAKLFGTPPAVAYNLAASLVYALAACLVFALGADLTRRVRGGIAATGAVLLLGNLQPLLQFAAHLRVTPHAPPFNFDWWAPSRVLHDQVPGQSPFALITEFPFFAAFHADLHPHLMALPFAFLFAAIAMSLLQVRRIGWPQGLLACWSLALLLWINPFDFIGWGGLAGLLLIIAASRHGGWRGALRGAAIGIALAAGACLLVLPFLAHYEPPRHVADFGPPLGLTEFRSGPGEFFLMWGLVLVPLGAWLAVGVLRARSTHRPAARWVADVGLALLAGAAVLLGGGFVAGGLATALVLVIRSDFRRARPPRRLFLHGLLAAAMILLLACELVYIRDPYGRGLQRMNTVFKFHFIAWGMLGLALPALLADINRRLRHRPRQWAFATTIGALGLVAGSYPVLAIGVRLKTFTGGTAAATYDGLRFMERFRPGDREAIAWLAENAPPGAVLLEGIGPAYGEHGRIAVFAPVRAVLGWANHESVWRGMDTAPIEADIQRLYSGTDAAEEASLLRKYGVSYIFVGELERRDHPAEALAALIARHAVVFTSTDGKAVICRVVDPVKPGR